MRQLSRFCRRIHHQRAHRALRPLLRTKKPKGPGRPRPLAAMGATWRIFRARERKPHPSSTGSTETDRNHGNPERVRLAFGPPPATTPTLASPSGLRELHLPHHTRSLARALRARPRQKPPAMVRAGEGAREARRAGQGGLSVRRARRLPPRERRVRSRKPKPFPFRPLWPLCFLKAPEIGIQAGVAMR